MGLKRIDERLSRVATIIKGWNGNHSVPRIERDLALEELRNIYDEILDYNPTEGGEENDSEVPRIVGSAEVITDIVDDFDDALDIDALLGIDAEEQSNNTPVEQPEERPIEQPVEEHTSETVEESAEECATEIVEESAEECATEIVEECAEEDAPEDSSVPQSVAGALFDLEDIPVMARGGRKMVHLYDSNYAPRVSPKIEPKEREQQAPVEASPVEQPTQTPRSVKGEAVVEQEVPKRLGDVLGSDVKTLADAIASDDEPTAPFNRVEELRKAIGLNDKFLMIRDLFGGDADRYEATIDTLDEFEDLDECMIYIVENFRWNPDSEAAKLIVSLLERKLS